MPVPLFVKYGIVAFFAFTWKWLYYAPNTYKQLEIHEMRRAGSRHVALVIVVKPQVSVNLLFCKT
jgi:hypothetical protein